MTQRMWTDEEVDRVHALRQSGQSIEQVAATLGRTFHSVRSRLGYSIRTEEQRRTRNKRMRRWRNGGSDLHSAHAHSAGHHASPKIPPEVLAEREARQLAPQSTTSLLMGDPPRGFSALDRRT